MNLELLAQGPNSMALDEREVPVECLGEAALPVRCMCRQTRAVTLMNGVPNKCLVCGGEVHDTVLVIPQSGPAKPGENPKIADDYLEKL